MRVTRLIKSSILLLCGLILLAPALTTLPAFATPSITEYTAPSDNYLDSITSGPDGALWYLANNDSTVRRVTTSGDFSGYRTDYFSPSLYNPANITTGPDGALWIADEHPTTGGIGRMTTSGDFIKYELPFSGPDAPYSPGAYGITTGPDGALWFTEVGANQIGRITTSGDITEYPLPGGNYKQSYAVYALNITASSDGALWFTEPGVNKVGRMTTDGSVTEYATSMSPQGITSGPDGAIWFTETGPNPSGMIGRISTSRQLTELNIPTPNAYPLGDITAGPDGALWFTDSNNSEIDRVTTAGQFTEYATPTSNSTPFAITKGPDGNIWFTEPWGPKIGKLVPESAPSAPTNLTIPSPTQNPSLSWDASSGATSYNIYRNGTNIFSTTNTSYQDNSAPEGTDTYYVTAVNSSGESGPSNSVSVLVDRTAPTITYSVSPTPNSNGWNNSSPVTVTFTCTDNVGGSGIASCSLPQSESSDGQYTLSGTAVDNAGNSSSVNVTVNLDQTAPTLGTPSWTNNPMATTQTTTVTIPVTDNLSGVVKGEYYLGTTDPGQGNGTPMTLSGGNLTASFANLTANVYTINFRAEDTAGNWSAPTTDDLVVYGSGTASGHGSVTPTSSDTLPTETGNNIRADFVFSLKYANPTDTTPTGMSTFMYGSQCHNPHSNCFTVTTDNTVTPTIGGLSWLVIPGNNTATFQGTASLSQGTTSLGNNYPIRVTVTGSTLTTPGHYELQVFQVGANPSTATPIYQVSEDLSGGNVTLT